MKLHIIVRCSVLICCSSWIRRESWGGGDAISRWFITCSMGDLKDITAQRPENERIFQAHRSVFWLWFTFYHFSFSYNSTRILRDTFSYSSFYHLLLPLYSPVTWYFCFYCLCDFDSFSVILPRVFQNFPSGKFQSKYWLKFTHV